MALVLVGDWLQGRGLPWQPSVREGCCRGRLMVTSGRCDGSGGGGFISLLDPASGFPPSCSMHQRHMCLIYIRIMLLYDRMNMLLLPEIHAPKSETYLMKQVRFRFFSGIVSEFVTISFANVLSEGRFKAHTLLIKFISVLKSELICI